MMKFGKFLPILLTLLNPLLSFADSNVLTMNEAIKKALMGNYIVKAEEKLSSSKLNLIKSAEYRDYPSIIADYTFTKLNDDKELSIKMGGSSMKVTQVEKSYSNLNIGINYVIYSGGVFSALKKGSIYDYDSSKHSLEEIKKELMLKIQEAYTDILELQEIRKVVISQINRLNSHNRDIEMMHKEGLAAKIDMMQTSVELKNAEKKLIEIDNNIKVAKYNLSTIMGEDPSDNYETIDPQEDFYNRNFDEKLIVEQSIQNRKILKKMEASLESFKQTIEIDKSNYKPKFSIYGGYNYNDSNDAITPKSGFLIQAGMNFRLDWGKPFSDIRSKKEEIYSYENRIKDLRLKIKLLVLKRLADFETAKKSYDVAIEQVKESEEFFRIMKLKYSNGLISNTDLLNAETIMTNSLMGMKKNYYEVARSIYRLEYEIGLEVN
ncbi:MAG: TolC family protein [Calditerrivibrio sp.]|nr:TolC family protein [Calditerrivibrio sp.]MCA1980231.1 TolC family protein [Calditerrivibrio sp.]